MITVTLYETLDENSSKKLVGFVSKGHADYDDSGKDIVCAAVSVLVINTVNSIEAFTDTEIEVKNGVGEDAFISMKVIDNPTNEADLLLKAFELGITQIAAGNPDYISITFKEV